MSVSNMSVISIFVTISVVLSAKFITAFCANYNLTSPCPRFFTYENNTEAEDRWYGAITIQSDYDLSGVWLRIVFDKPVSHIRSAFGEVFPRDQTEYLIKNPEFKLLGSIPHTVRFYVQFAVDETPANLIGFRLNGRVLCPENIRTGTATERLFTSWKTSDLEGFEHSEGSNVTAIVDGQNRTLYISSANDIPEKSNGTITTEPQLPLPLGYSVKVTEKITDNITDDDEATLPQEEGTLYVSQIV